ncbi:MAG: BtrH N-terminal domain-containing protein [Lentisphaerae bacterium]|nr:BtrH N-terminal domain-containing protein [Lentisphaerota bacterium]
MTIEFQHHQSAHCESGVMSNLLRHEGLNIDEPLAFGIGSALFFAHIPFLKLDNNKIPLTTFRMNPGVILKRVTKLLGVGLTVERFGDVTKAMDAMDRRIEMGFPVGLQVGVFWLPFFPDALRFHFNAHNMVVYGKEGDEYMVSDPTLPEPVRCSARDMRKARFSKGPLAPHGKMYYITSITPDPPVKKAVLTGIKRTCFLMKNPFPIGGVNGIRYLAGRIRKWPGQMPEDQAILYLTNVIRMQEEIGTGGAGFRFLFAAFLQRAADRLPQREWLSAKSSEMTAIGDKWREFALMAAKICKKRNGVGDTFGSAADIVEECWMMERTFFADMCRNLKT